MHDLLEELAFHCSLFLTKYHGNEKDPFKLVSDLRSFQRVNEMLHPNQQ
jgi:hypothetical protein